MTPTAKRAIMKAYLSDRIELIEKITILKTKLDIPCGKDMYYDRYRKFFWLLDNSRK